MKPIAIVSLCGALTLGAAGASAQPTPAAAPARPPAPAAAPARPPAPAAAPARKPTVISPELDADRRVTFRLAAPEARAVTVVGQWTKDKLALSKDADGLWSATVGPVEPGVWEYSFVVDGVQMLDPSNPSLKPMRRPRTSILEVPAARPALTEFQDVPHGTVHVLHYRSKATNAVRRLHVYTPPGYEARPGGKLPVLYLLHGNGDNDATWTVHGRAHFVVDNLIAAGQVKPLVVVMTDGHLIPETASRDTIASMGDNTDLYGRDLLESVLPLVEKTFRVRADAAGRALVGLSMGGQQALSVGLNHADKFAWVGGMSAAVPPHDKLPLDDAKGLNRKLRWLWLGCGREDFLLDRNTAFVAALQAKGVKHEWRLTDGGHSWPIWRGYLVDVLPRLFTPPPRS